MRALGVDLVDHGACTAGALIVHRRDFFLAAGDWIFFEDDDLGVLAAQFNDGAALGVELFNREGYRVNFLHEFCTEQENLPPPLPVMKMRLWPATMPTSSSMRLRNSMTFSGCLVSWRW